ncbi:MAG: serine/threonine protein kinase, partial [Anaerolineaceae bacterium]|nr:serine/threonine protein kinase [Anaerolineaceae bacterium]
MILRPGTVVGGCYRIGAVLGKGGFGITYHGFDFNAHRDVAIKEFFPKGMAERAGQSKKNGKHSSRVVAIQTDNIKIYQKSLKMFYKEAQTLYKLSGIPNVPKVYRIFQENGTAYIVMEYIEGKSLNQLLKENGAFSEEELLPLLDPVLEALEKVHALGIVHRDIAPDNVVINESGQAVLLDFGASRGDIGQDADSGTSASSSLIVQKNGFSPPEQLSGETEPRSDIYALGATYYTLLSGSVPQASSNRAGRDRVRPLKELRISSGVSDAVMKAMSLRIDDRWSDTAEFRKALNSAYLDPRDQKYYYAKGLMTSGHYEQAMEILNEISGWKNADEMISECGEKISSQKPEPDSGTEQETTTYVKPAPVRETTFVQKTRPGMKMIIFGAVLAAVAVIFLILYPGKGPAPKDTETLLPAAVITSATDKPVVTETAAVSPQAKVLYTGDIITFGRYEQDEYTGADPIEWQVLTVEDGRALVVSRYVLAAKAYNDTLAHITWENCSLRKWLNEDFYNIAFSSREREKIKEVLNSNPGNDNVEGGNDTQDRIFLLSSREASRYFKNNDARRCPGSYRAIQNGVNVNNGYAWWWLRSPGTTVGKAADVISGGYVGLDGSDIRFISLGVRPALWLDPSDPSVFEVIVSNKPQPLSEKKSLKAEDSFTFGQYEQDNDPDNGMEAIEWQVLAVENGRALVISQYGLDAKQ